LPRREEEAFHEIVLSIHPDMHGLAPNPTLGLGGMQGQSHNIRLSGHHSLYRQGYPVGKSSDQVGMSNKALIGNDADFFVKWSQALSSAHDLTYLSCSDGAERTRRIALSLVFPVVVVPDDRLWIARFDADGERIGNPTRADRCSYYVNSRFVHLAPYSTDEVTLSHVEFLTVTGLSSFIDELCADDDRLAATFPLNHIEERIATLE
jgi:hypothetical protein